MRNNPEVLRPVYWAAFALAIGVGSGVYFSQQNAPSTDPCAAVLTSTMAAGLLPSDALVEIHRARGELARRHAAHERSRAQLLASLPQSAAEERPWISKAVMDEQAILAEVEQAEEGLEETAGCLDAE